MNLSLNTTLAALPKPKAILFDFDGTLADTAPDLVEATQSLLRARQLPELPYQTLRQVCSSGARGLLGTAFGVDKTDAQFEPLRQEFLAAYRACLTQNTRLFDGVEALLRQLQAHGIAWGIVTNKATDLTTPIVAHLLQNIGLHPVTVVCGDTTAFTKPHPAPLLLACEQAGCKPMHCWYVGDDRRDVQSAVTAGCVPVAVSYGYHGDNDPPYTWGAVTVLKQPMDVWVWA